MNDISSGEKDVSCADVKLIFAICHPVPTTSKYNLALSISSATKLSVDVVFCRIASEAAMVVIVCSTPTVDTTPL